MVKYLVTCEFVQQRKRGWFRRIYPVCDILEKRNVIVSVDSEVTDQSSYASLRKEVIKVATDRSDQLYDSSVSLVMTLLVRLGSS